MPATSANLGPGFDSLGLALEPTTTSSPRWSRTASSGGRGEGADDVARDETHLVVEPCGRRRRARGAPPGLRLAPQPDPARPRTGSSSAALVAGIVLARALVLDGAVPMTACSESARDRIEGHPDNVGPALLGGFVICGQSGEDVWAEPSPLHPSISAVVFVRPDGVLTEAARGMLPETVPHAGAAANTARAALLVRALDDRPTCSCARPRTSCTRCTEGR